MERNWKLRATASAVASLALLGACGGGSDSKEQVQSARGSDKIALAAEPAVRVLLDRAAQSGVSRTVHAIGAGNLGAYGRSLAAQGYDIKFAASLDGFPDSAETIVYINSEDVAGLQADDLSRLENFKGVLVLDSEQVAAGDPARALTDPDDPNPTKVDIASAEVQGNGRVGELYRKISGSRAGMGPEADVTAVVTSGVIGSFMPLHVDAAGGVNGYGAENFEAVGPLLYALAARDTAAGKLAQANQRSPYSAAGPADGRKGALNITGVSWDRVVDFNKSSNGYNFRGRVYALAWREAGPTFANARKFVDVIFDSGSNDTGCLVSGLACGAYPNDKYQVVKSGSTSGDGDILVSAAPYLYYAQVGIKPYQQTLQWQPRSTQWTSTSTKESDSWEETWSKGFALGGAAGINSAGVFLLNFSGGYSRSNTYRKRSYAWVGWENNFTDAESYLMVASGLTSVNRKVRGAAESSGKWISGSTDANWERMNDTLLNGLWADCEAFDGQIFCDAAKQKVNGDGSPRSKIAWQGWNPAISSSQEIPKNHFPSATDTTKTVSVKAQMGAVRDRWYFTRKNGNDLNCWSSSKKPGYVLKGNTQLDCKANNVRTANSTNWTGQTMSGTVTFTLSASYFNN